VQTWPGEGVRGQPIVKRSQHKSSPTAKRQEDSSTKAVPQQNKRDITFKQQTQRPQRTTPPKSHRIMHHNAHSHRNNRPTTPPHLSTHSSSFKSRTQMKITCSAWSSCPFVLHTMRGTHDKVTCSRHTRKEQPFGLQPGTREAKCKAPTSSLTRTCFAL
jgi:hypothetical protein